MTEIFSGLGDFITGIFSAVGNVITGITGQPVLLAFVILLPLMSIGIGLLMKFLGKKKGKRK